MSRPRSPADTAERVLELVAAVDGSAEAQVTVTEGRSALTRFANSHIHQNVAEDLTLVVLRVAVDGRPASVSANRVDADALERLVDGALVAARLRPVDPFWPGLAPPAAASAVEHWDEATAEASPDARAAQVEAFVGGDERLVAAGYCDTTALTRAYANSAGQRLAGRATVATLQGIHRLGGAEGGDERTACALGDLDGASLGAVSADRAARGVDPVELDPGRYEVVLGPSCVSNVLAFLATGFSGRAVHEGRSFAHLGEAQFDGALSLWDDADDPRAVGYTFDSEGTPRRRTDFVRDGVTSALYYDRTDARRVGGQDLESTGGHPTNLFLSGRSPVAVDQLIGQVERGLLVHNFHYTRILDPKTQVVTGLTRGGVFLIEDGRVGPPVRNLRFTQSYAAALGPGRLLGAGDDGRLVSGSWVPTLRLASWNFTGGAKG